MLVVLDMFIIPVGGAVVGIYLLLRKRWAVIPAALIPLRALIDLSADKLERVGTQFHLYNEGGQLTNAGSGVNHLLQFVAFWTVYIVMLVYLWEVWTLLRQRELWGPALGSTAGEIATESSSVQSGDGDVCFLLPEADDVESL